MWKYFPTFRYISTSAHDAGFAPTSYDKIMEVKIRIYKDGIMLQFGICDDDKHILTYLTKLYSGILPEAGIEALKRDLRRFLKWLRQNVKNILMRRLFFHCLHRQKVKRTEGHCRQSLAAASPGSHPITIAVTR